MTSSSTIDVSADCSRIAILVEMRLTLRLRAQLPEIDDIRKTLMAHVGIGSQEQHGCTEHTP